MKTILLQRGAFAQTLLKVALLTLAFGFWTINSVAQCVETLSFSTATNIPAGTNPRLMVTADFNGDGIPDLAVANQNSANVSIFLGNGAGGFSAATNFPTGNGPYGITTADFNGDGKADIAVCNLTDATVSVLLGDGAGNFGAPSTISAGTAPRILTTGDFNGDGKPDLAVASHLNSSTNVAVLLGNGNGTFGTATLYGAGNNPMSIISADFNGDGKTDLAVANQTGFTISILLGNGTGGFGTATNFSAGSFLAPVSIVSGDFNGDGKLDLAETFSNSANAGVLLGDGTGSFGAATNFPVTGGTINSAIVTGDFNGDGKPDLAVSNASNSIVSVLPGNGNGTFGAATTASVGTVTSQAGIVCADFNGDGKPDLATSNYGAGNVSVLLNTSAATLPTISVTPSTAVCTGASSVALTASGTSTSYTWSPATNLTPSNGTSATETVQVSLLTFYTVTGTGANGCTNSLVVPVATSPTGGTISPVSSIICSGGTKLLTVAGAAGHDYQWQLSADNTTWTNIPGATNTGYTTASGNGATLKYYRLESNSNTCWNVMSTTAIVDISNPVITVSATNITDQTITLNWTPVGSGNYSVSWSGASAGSSSNATPPKTITGLTPGGTYSITITQTGAGLSGCPASGTISPVITLCGAPTAVTATTPANNQVNVSWTGAVGNYRVFYRPLFTANTYFTQDVTGATSATITKLGNNILPASTTFEVYVTTLDCPTTGVIGQPSSKIYVTTPPAKACATPVIDSVKSTCPIQIEVWMHPGSSPSGVYQIYFQRLTPTIQAVVSYQVTGNYFTVNIGSAGQTYLIAASSDCSGSYSNLVYWPGNITVKPLCSTINNLALSNPTCHGFTASWNIDQCLSNNVSYYQIYLRQQGNVNWNSYPVQPVPAPPVAPSKTVTWLGKGTIYQVYVRSIYSCNGYNTAGPASQILTDTTKSAGCRDEDQQTEPNQPSVQQYSPDKNEVMSIYPNPNNGEFMLDISQLNSSDGTVRVEVFNVLGQTIMTGINNISEGQLSEFIGLPGATVSGNYFVRVTVGKNVYTTKVNISR